jgi:hypothetical protein
VSNKHRPQTSWRTPRNQPRELAQEEYVRLAFRKLQSIIEAIGRGQRPLGHINLFSDLNINVLDPRRQTALTVVNKFNRQWLNLLEEAEIRSKEEHTDLAELGAYYFHAEYVVTVNGGPNDPERGTVIVTFCHAEPDTDLRMFAPEDSNP